MENDSSRIKRRFKITVWRQIQLSTRWSKVTAENNDKVVAVEASGDWDGYVWYTVTVK